MTDFCCPRCRGVIEDLSCRACQLAFFTVGQQKVPVLVDDPEAFLASTHVELERVDQELVARLVALQRLAAQGVRPLAIDRWRTGFDVNLQLRRRLVGELPRTTLPAKPRLVGYVRDVLESVRMDWTDDPAGLAGLIEIAGTLIQRHARDRGVVLVPGAGSGRFAVEACAWFDKVIALDLSMMFALLYDHLLRETLTFAQVTDRNARTIADLSSPLQAAIPPSLADAARGVTWVVANALQSPIPTNAVSAVISAFFTDAVPPTQFLTECARVIAPGGLFVHAGPLGWHFHDPLAMWSREELREALPRFGFDLVEEAEAPIELFRTPGRMVFTHVDAWVFVARRHG